MTGPEYFPESPPCPMCGNAPCTCGSGPLRGVLVERGELEAMRERGDALAADLAHCVARKERYCRALITIAEMPIAEQDTLISASMRKMARAALDQGGGT